MLLPARASCETGFLASGGPFKAMVDALDEVLRSPDDVLHYAIVESICGMRLHILYIFLKC